MKRNILITGGAGFIGGDLASALSLDESNNITIIDNLRTSTLETAPKSDNIRFVRCDVNNYKDVSSIFYTTKFDYVFHYAALVGVERTLKNPIAVLEDIKGIENILKLSKNTGVKRVFYSSSSEVYGEPVEIPQNEHTTPLNSRLPYAIVKNLGEAFFRSYQQEYGLDYTIFRFFNTYGKRQSKDFVVARFLRSALLNEPITVYGDGNQTRTFCYIEDNVAACIQALNQDQYINDVVNIGSDKEIQVIDLAKKIIEVTNSRSPILNLPPLPEGDMKRRMPDVTKMKALLNRELTPLEQGLKNILEDKQKILAKVDFD
jgi:UDP-glucuronate decarboxylase